MSRLSTAPAGSELRHTLRRGVGSGFSPDRAGPGSGGSSPTAGPSPGGGASGSHKTLPEVYKRVATPGSPGRSVSTPLLPSTWGAGGDLSAALRPGSCVLSAKRLTGLPPLGQPLQGQLQAHWSSAPNLLDPPPTRGSKVQLRSLASAEGRKVVQWEGTDVRRSLAELGTRRVCVLDRGQEREATEQRPRSMCLARAPTAAAVQEQGRRKTQAAASKAGQKGLSEKVWIPGLVPRNTISLAQQQQLLRGTTAPELPGGAPTAPGQKRVIKNPAVWQRYQVQPRSGLACTEVLERDRHRERQRSVVPECVRQTASPTKSRTAAIFFESLPGNDESVYECLPPGALRHMARPQLRTTGLMDAPARAAGSAVSSTLLCARRQSQGSMSKEMREVSEEAVFEGNEELLLELGNVLDAYAALVAPPGAPPVTGLPATIGAGRVGTIAEAEGSLLREATSNLNLGETRELPVLRPLFCRFLLASGLCGSDESEFNFHECVAAFDAEATQPLSGTPSGLYRSTLLKVLAAIIWPDRGREDFEDRSESQQLEIIACMKKKIRAMFEEALPSAMDHCKARRKRLEDRRGGMAVKDRPPRSPSKDGQDSEPPESGRAELHVPIISTPAGIMWPPLPPKYVTEKELPAYMEGVQQWEFELRSQNADRLRALRIHTDAVLLGEILVGQLLEPEVLHFSTRFRPLFERLFEEYADWPVLARGPVVTPEDGKRGRCEHMSFAAFFKFCVDFDLFPKHASFEEIQKIYGDSEALEPAVRPEEEPAAAVAAAAADEACGEAQRAPLSEPTTPNRRGSALVGRSNSKRGSRLLPGPTPKEIEPAKRAQAAKRRGTASAASVAPAEPEASLPRVVDMQLFERPVMEMTDFEVQCLAFLAGVGEWLGERFIRLADYVANYDVHVPDEEPAEALALSSLIERRTIGSSTSASGAAARRVLHLPAGRRSTIPTVEERKSSLASLEETNASIGAVSQSMMQTVMVGARRFYELTLPMGTARPMTEEEVVQMYRLLLNDLELDEDSPLPEIPVFQLDKAVYRATQRMEQERRECCRLFRKDEDQSHSDKVCCRFFEAFDTKLRERHLFGGGDLEDVFEDLFQDGSNLMPQELLEVASELGVHEDLHPLPAELAHVFVQVGAGSGAGISKPLFWRLLAVLQERFRWQRQADNRNRMQCLAHMRHCGPGATVFGLAAFVECLLKLALHRLGSKGGSEIQRASPSWWKCIWLLMLLGGRFAEHLQVHRHYCRIRGLAVAAAPPPFPVAPSRSSIPAHDLVVRSNTGPASTYFEAERGEDEESSVWPSLPSTPATMPQQQQRQGRGSSDRVRALSTRTGSSAPSTPRTSASAPAAHSLFAEPRLRSALRWMESKRKPEPSSTKDPPPRDELAQSLDVWWRYIYNRTLPTYAPPLARLMREVPRLFDHTSAESQIAGSVEVFTALCPLCLEPRSPSGWGSPGCASCSGVEEFCLPFEDHLFSELLRTPFLPLGSAEENSEASSSRPGSAFQEVNVGLGESV